MEERKVEVTKFCKIRNNQLIKCDKDISCFECWSEQMQLDRENNECGD